MGKLNEVIFDLIWPFLLLYILMLRALWVNFPITVLYWPRKNKPILKSCLRVQGPNLWPVRNRLICHCTYRFSSTISVRMIPKTPVPPLPRRAIPKSPNSILPSTEKKWDKVSSTRPYWLIDFIIRVNYFIINISWLIWIISYQYTGSLFSKITPLIPELFPYLEPT